MKKAPSKDTERFVLNLFSFVQIRSNPSNTSNSKTPENRMVSGVFGIPQGKLSLGELRCATCGFEAVLAYSLAPVFLDFMGFLASALKCCPSI